jgi:hypothetical protein
MLPIARAKTASIGSQWHQVLPGSMLHQRLFCRPLSMAMAVLLASLTILYSLFLEYGDGNDKRRNAW